MDERITSYHLQNKTNLKDFRKGEKNARSQEELVKLYYNCFKRPEGYTADEMHDALVEIGAIKSAVPPTSIRRAMSNLDHDTVLWKDEKTQRMGKFGRMTCAYRLNNTEQYRLAV